MKQLTIQDVLVSQKELNIAMGNPMGHGHIAVKENVLAAVAELIEVLDEVPWKPWKKYDSIPENHIDREALLTEMTDVLQFWANMVNSMGYTADEVALSLAGKWSENYRRLSAQ